MLYGKYTETRERHSVMLQFIHHITIKKFCKFCCVPLFLLWQLACLSAQICGIWPDGEIPRETAVQSAGENGQPDLLQNLPMIRFFNEKVKVNGNELQLSLSLVPDRTLQNAKDYFAGAFPQSSRYYTGSSLQVTLPQTEKGIRELSLVQLNGIPELILFTLDQSAAQQTQKFQIPADFKQQYFIPENAEDLVFVEYPMRNARVLSFQIPEKDSGKILKMIHTHLLARQWQPGKQEKLMTEAVPQEEKKDVGRNTSEPEEEPLAPVYYQDREQKLLLLFYRIENNICRFSYYERPLEN